MRWLTYALTHVIGGGFGTSCLFGVGEVNNWCSAVVVGNQRDSVVRGCGACGEKFDVSVVNREQHVESVVEEGSLIEERQNACRISRPARSVPPSRAL